MLMNLLLMSLCMSDILRIDVVTIISLALRINFAKIYTSSEVALSIT